MVAPDRLLRLLCWSLVILVIVSAVVTLGLSQRLFVDYALGVGWAVQLWLAMGAVTIVGVGAAVAGRLVAMSPLWTTLSYLIAVALFVAVALNLLGFGDVSLLLIGITTGIAVPIWAILLARGASLRRPTTEMVVG